MNSLMNYCIPDDMEEYLSYYGLHFNKKLYQFAVSMMKEQDKQTGKITKIIPPSIDEVKSILEKHNVEIEPSNIYDAAYLAAMVKADFWGSSIEDEQHMALYIKDVLRDPDGYTGIVICRFIADCNAKGIPIYWDLML